MVIGGWEGRCYGIEVGEGYWKMLNVQGVGGTRGEGLLLLKEDEWGGVVVLVAVVSGCGGGGIRLMILMMHE